MASIRDYKDYCDNVTVELSEWKEKVEKIVRKLDSMSTGDKEKVVGELNGLHILTHELNERIEGLSKACMLNWEPRRGEDHDVVWPEQTSKTFGSVSQSDFGG
jgi:hypothetical protein